MSQPPRRPLVVGNWKMNGRRQSVRLAADLTARVRADELGCDLVLCPPATLLLAVGEAIAGSSIALGAQDCHWAPEGAHTGDLSAGMLADAGCRFVILGHSERRAGHGESDAIVAAKAQAAHEAGLVAIVCLGEAEAERQRGDALAVVEHRLKGSLPPSTTAANTALAYEPVWAIGSGRTPAPAEVAAVHTHLHRLLRERLVGGAGVRVLYGGSVKPSNAEALLRAVGVDGALVGGASLSADEFWAIARSCR